MVDVQISLIHDSSEFSVYSVADTERLRSMKKIQKMKIFLAVILCWVVRH